MNTPLTIFSASMFFFVAHLFDNCRRLHKLTGGVPVSPKRPTNKVRILRSAVQTELCRKGGLKTHSKWNVGVQSKKPFSQS